jgi:hypothetical protein
MRRPEQQLPEGDGKDNCRTVIYRRGIFMSKYSQLYIEGVRPEPDSDRVRVRLCALFQETFEGRVREDAKRFLTRQLGVRVLDTGDFFETCEIRDLLDTVTEVTRFIETLPGIANASEASRGCNRSSIKSLWRRT